MKTRILRQRLSTTGQKRPDIQFKRNICHFGNISNHIVMKWRWKIVFHVVLLHPMAMYIHYSFLVLLGRERFESVRPSCLASLASSPRSLRPPSCTWLCAVNWSEMACVLSFSDSSRSLSPAILWLRRYNFGLVVVFTGLSTEAAVPEMVKVWIACESDPAFMSEPRKKAGLRTVRPQRSVRAASAVDPKSAFCSAAFPPTSLLSISRSSGSCSFTSGQGRTTWLALASRSSRWNSALPSMNQTLQ